MALERDIILVYGMTGMGKSRWTRAFLRSQSRVFIMDTQVEHEGLLFDDLGDMIDHVMRYKAFRCRTEYVPDFPLLCSVAFAAGRCWLVVEEAQRVLPASRKELPASFEDLVYRGRHKQVNLILVSQRPSTVHIAARSQWSRIITFKQTEPADVAWITSVSGVRDINPLTLPQSVYYDIRPDHCEKKVLDDVRSRDATIPLEPEPSSQQEEDES